MTKFLYNYLWIPVISVFILLYFLSVSEQADNLIVYRDVEDSTAANGAGTIAALGDLQRTSFWEILIGREQNDEEREKLIKELRKENPEVLVLLGDMVRDGGKQKSWEYFDNLMLPFRQIPVLPVLGNHDYAGSGNSSDHKQAARRFRQIEKSTWYIRVIGDIALIFLDTNEDNMTALKWEEQKLWFKKMLSDYERQPGIKGIIVFAHHPPYTNSLLTGDEKNIQNAFVESFIHSPKTLAFISGHAHTYEHFIIDGKNFFVSGGGGGPRVLLKKGSRGHKDETTIKGKRPFHYMLLRPGSGFLDLQVKGIDKYGKDFFLVDSIRIKYPSLGG